LCDPIRHRLKSVIATSIVNNENLKLAIGVLGLNGVLNLGDEIRKSLGLISSRKNNPKAYGLGIYGHNLMI